MVRVKDRWAREPKNAPREIVGARIRGSSRNSLNRDCYHAVMIPHQQHGQKRSLILAGIATFLGHLRYQRDAHLAQLAGRYGDTTCRPSTWSIIQLRFARFRYCWLLGLAGVLLPLSGVSCGSSHGPRLTTQELTAAPVAPMEVPQFGPLSDIPSLGSIYTPLGPRLGLVQVSTAREWQRLRAAAPWLLDEPHWETGSFVGMVSHAGQPLDDDPPIKLRYVRVLEGAGLVLGDFSSGSYLPDGSAYLTGTYVSGLKQVLLIEISDVRYRP